MVMVLMTSHKLGLPVQHHQSEPNSSIGAGGSLQAPVLSEELLAVDSQLWGRENHCVCMCGYW